MVAFNGNDPMSNVYKEETLAPIDSICKSISFHSICMMPGEIFGLFDMKSLFYISIISQSLVID